MSKKIKILAISIIILSLGIFGWQNIGERTSAQPDGASKAIRQQPNTRGESENIFAEQSVPAQTELSFTAAENSTVYDLMQKLKAENKIAFTEKNYIGMGKLIDNIGGLKSNGDKTWIYYVNGAKASVGVSNYQIKPGDVVSWKYEKLLAY